MEALALIAVAAVGIGYAAWRATIVFELVAERGAIVQARGRMPSELYRELADVLGRARVTGRVRGRLRGGVELQTGDGVGPDVAQRLRNVLGRFPAARIKTGPPLRSPRGDG